MTVSVNYNGIEPRLCEGHKHGIEPGLSAKKMEDIIRKAEKSGVEICCLSTPCCFSNPDTAPENIELAKRVLDLARGIVTLESALRLSEILDAVRKSDQTGEAVHL